MKPRSIHQQAPAACASTEYLDACDVCGSQRFISVAPHAHIVECAACGYRFVNPRPSLEEIAHSYSDPHFYDNWVSEDLGRARMWNKRLELVRSAATGSRLLDIGAGIGTFLALARDQLDWTVTGTEVSTSACKLARQRYNIQLLQGEAEDAALPSKSFDTVTLWHVLEHVSSPSRLLRFCHDVLVPGGLLVVAVPNDSEDMLLPRRVKSRILALLSVHDAPYERYRPLVPGSEIHLSHFATPVLTRLVEQEGFRVRRISVDDQYPQPSPRTNLLIAAYRAILRLTGRNLGHAILLLAERQ